MRRALPLCLVCLVVGCGGSTPHSAPPVGPLLPHALAYRLAGESDALAGALDRGDGCAAKAAGTQLRGDLTASIGQVPASLQEPLSSRVNAILAELPTCSRATPTPPSNGDHGGKGGGDNGGNGDGGGGD